MKGQMEEAVKEFQIAGQLLLPTAPEAALPQVALGLALIQLAQALQRKGQTARAKELFAQVSKAKSEKLQPT